MYSEVVSGFFTRWDHRRFNSTGMMMPVMEIVKAPSTGESRSP